MYLTSFILWTLSTFTKTECKGDHIPPPNKLYIDAIPLDSTHTHTHTLPPLEPVSPVKLVVYDFDQTIITVDLYRLLSGMQGDQDNALQTMSDRELTKVFGGNKR
eukprot:21003_1